MSQVHERDSYYDPENDLDDFIVDNEPEVEEDEQEDDEPVNDRILLMTTALKPNESQTQKLLKAHISVLVSALGGPDHTSQVSPPPYKLGHDALACLKDIKRWIKSYDEKNQSYEVALACADSGLVINDLVVILCQWETAHQKKEPIKNARTAEKVMLACLELLVLLTWPVELVPESSENQRLLYAEIKKAQINYKHTIISFTGGQTLKAIIRLVLPVIAKNRLDREPRDNAILRLVLFFLRNILFIEPANSSVSSKSHKQVIDSDNMPSNITYDDISINAVLASYKKNRALMLLLTIAGAIGTDFDKDIFGPTCLECIFLIIKGIKASDVLGLRKESQPINRAIENAEGNASQPLQSVTTTSGMQLQDLLASETKRKRNQTQNLQTRHGRFGTLLSIRTTDANSLVISGQEALHNTDSSLEKLDRTKKWNSRTLFKYDSDEFVKSNNPVYLNQQGRQILQEFIEQFLSGGCYNNLIESMSSLFSGMHDFVSIDEYEKATFFLTTSWFLSYKRERNIWYNSDPARLELLGPGDDSNDFGSVGAGLSEINFILIIGYFRDSFSLKRWSSLHAAMVCFKELLQISQSLFGKNTSTGDDDLDSQHEIDRELAEGIIRKLFSFNDFINIIVSIPQTASKHSPEYLSCCLSVVHIILKSFETFANEDVKLYVQTKRKRAKQKKSRINDLDKNTEDSLRDVIDNESDQEDFDERMKEVKRERRLDFNTTEIRFFQTSIVSTYVEYLSRYEDLTHEEIKRCLSYFHRLFVVRKDFTGLYRLDFMNIIHKLRNFLPRGSSIRKHTDEFIYYFMKKFKVAFERFPNPIEILFPRFEEAECKTYLATGELFIKPESSKKTSLPRLAKPLEFVRDSLSLDEKIKILVSALHLEEKEQFLGWLIVELERILVDRVSGPEAIVELKPAPQYRRPLITSGSIRLLLSTIGFELPYLMDENCELPAEISSEDFTTSIELIKKWNSQQPATFEDGKDPSYFMRVKEAYSEDYGDDDVDYNGVDQDDDAIAFVTEPNAAAVRNNFSELDNLDALERSLEVSGIEKGKARKKGVTRREKPAKEKASKPKTKHRSRRPPRSFNIDSDDDGEKQYRPIKSSEYVGDSDDDSDDEKEREFFNREERLRQLLNSSGGIVDPSQLREFKKAWAKLESSRGSDTAKSVSLAIQETSLFVNESDNEEQPHTELELSQIAVSQESSKSSQVSGHSDTENFSEVEDDTPGTDIDIQKKRPRIVTDSEDEASEEEEEPEPTRKKRIVLSDDEE